MPRGRPPSGKARRTRIDFSLTPEVYSKAEAAANASDMSLRAWIVMVVEQSLKGVGMPVTSADLDKVKETLALIYDFLDRLPVTYSGKLGALCDLRTLLDAWDKESVCQ